MNGWQARIEKRGFWSPAELRADSLAGADVICDVEGYERTLLDPMSVRKCDFLGDRHGGLDPEITPTLLQRFEDTHARIITRPGRWRSRARCRSTDACWRHLNSGEIRAAGSSFVSSSRATIVAYEDHAAAGRLDDDEPVLLDTRSLREAIDVARGVIIDVAAIRKPVTQAARAATHEREAWKGRQDPAAREARHLHV